jgi:hypothetical protein
LDGYNKVDYLIDSMKDMVGLMLSSITANDDIELLGGSHSDLLYLIQDCVDEALYPEDNLPTRLT